MPDIEVVTGPPFSGKGRFVRDEIARRERAGELGLLALDWTALYTAMVPGPQSAYRDAAVSDTGSTRMVSYVFEVAAAAIMARELRGYLVAQSPRRALALADRFGVEYVLETAADLGDIADRADGHMADLGRTVSRASRANAAPLCRRAAVAYQCEAPALVGRARTVRRKGRGWQVGEVKRPFDRALWIRGLTPRGRTALDDLVADGNPEPTPADVMARLLRERRADG